MSETREKKSRVIARFRTGRVLKGYLRHPAPPTGEKVDSQSLAALPTTLTILSADSAETISLQLESLKALFFVKTFEGDKDYNEVKFFDRQPAIGGLWVRVQFQDKESLEGVIQNSLAFLIEPGFFMRPPDPESNNQILYVIKSSLRDFRIMGVKPNF